MKVLPFKIPKPEKDAFVYQVDCAEVLYDKLHQHEEMQLSYVLKGKGTLIVGDTVHQYAEGDVFMIGSYLPHVFKSDATETISHMLSLFFTATSFGDAFFDLEELKSLQPFFERIKHGFKVTSHKEEIKTLFLKLEDSAKLERFMLLLQILKTASQASYESLSSFVYDKKYSDNEGYRMRNVFEYTMNHYTDEITLEMIAEVANMTKNAFCKYFKKRTNKTYITFLNEVRIEHACKLLAKHQKQVIAEIGFACGFRNVSNFNRTFNAIKGMTPKQYRNRVLKMMR